MPEAMFFARLRVPFSITFGFPILRKTESSKLKLVEDEGYIEFKSGYVVNDEDFSITIHRKEELKSLVDEVVKNNETEISAFLYRNNIQDYVSIGEIKEWLVESLIGFFNNNFLLTELSVKSPNRGKYKKYRFTPVRELAEEVKRIISKSTFYEKHKTHYFSAKLKEVIESLEYDEVEEGVESINDLTKSISKTLQQVTKDWETIEKTEIVLEDNRLSELTRKVSEYILLDHIFTNHSDYYEPIYYSMNEIFRRAIDFGLSIDYSMYGKKEKAESVVSFNKNFKEIKLPNGEVTEVRGYSFLVIRHSPYIPFQEKGVPGIVVGIEFPALKPGGRELSGGGAKSINKGDRVESSNLFSGIGFLFEILEEPDYGEIESSDTEPEVLVLEKPTLNIGTESMSSGCKDCFEEGNVELIQRLHLEYDVGFLKSGLAFFYTKNKVSYSRKGGEGEDEFKEYSAWGKTYYVVFEDYDETVEKIYKNSFKLKPGEPESLALSLAFPAKVIDLALRTTFVGKPGYYEPGFEADPISYEEYFIEKSSAEGNEEVIIRIHQTEKGETAYLGDDWEFSFSLEDQEKEEFIEKSLDYIVLDLLKSPLSRNEELIKNISPLKAPLEREYFHIKVLASEDLCFKSGEGEKVKVSVKDENVKKVLSDLEYIMWERKGEVSERFTISEKENEDGIRFEITGTLYDEISRRGGRAMICRVNVSKYIV